VNIFVCYMPYIVPKYNNVKVLGKILYLVANLVPNLNNI